MFVYPLPPDPPVCCVSILSVRVCVCEAGVSTVTLHLCGGSESVRSRTTPWVWSLSVCVCVCLCVCVVPHPSSLINPRVSLTHTRAHTRGVSATRCLSSSLWVCVSSQTLIGPPSNPHRFLGSQSDSREPMRCRRGRWTWESPNQIPRSDQSRSLLCCMSLFLPLTLDFCSPVSLRSLLPWMSWTRWCCMLWTLEHGMMGNPSPSPPVLK